MTNYIQPDHTTSTKSEKHLNRPLTKPQKPKTSKSTTRQTLTSKSLCHVENHAFGLVPTKRYCDDFNTSIFCPKTSETPYLLGFSHTRQFTLVINTTHSTWPEFRQPMSVGQFQILRLWKHVNDLFCSFRV